MAAWSSGTGMVEVWVGEMMAWTEGVVIAWGKLGRLDGGGGKVALGGPTGPKEPMKDE